MNKILSAFMHIGSLFSVITSIVQTTRDFGEQSLLRSVREEIARLVIAGQLPKSMTQLEDSTIRVALAMHPNVPFTQDLDADGIPDVLAELASSPESSLPENIPAKKVVKKGKK